MKICIDPGHGRGARIPFVNDPGAVSGGHTEAKIAYDWAITLKTVLAEAGIDFCMTRPTAKAGMLTGRRAKWAERQGATHFISLHCNAGPSSATGTETFRRVHSPWVSAVHRSAVKTIGLRDRGLKTESQSQHPRIAVLSAPNACLLELGFITNAEDRERLLSRDVRLAFAQALVAEIKKLP
jgi:N-acetylmuramoyl-L-alanine amidase